jgi:hypothetical protein
MLYERGVRGRFGQRGIARFRMERSLASSVFSSSGASGAGGCCCQGKGASFTPGGGLSSTNSPLT